jgi:hypothetical protein
MAMGSGLLVLALMAADGPSCPQAVETTTYQVRVLTMDGLDWRTSAYSRLQPVARQGGSTIWTADKTLASALAERARDASPCHTIMAVGEAVMTKADTTYYNAAVERVADGPVNQASALAFMPHPEAVEERFSIKVEGRKLDQGVLTKILLEDTHVDAIHTVSQTETLVRPRVDESSKKSGAGTLEIGKATFKVLLSPNETEASPTSITSSVKIPEVTRASVTGEWLIPNDGVLIVSLGVKTAADKAGKAVARERVAVIEACPSSTTPTDPKTITSASNPPAAPVMTSPVTAASFAHTKLAQPVVPGRALPEAYDPGGKLIDLPPLPEALASADLDRIKPDQPSPQAPVMSSPSTDPSLARTSFDAAPPAPNTPSVNGRRGVPFIPAEVIEALMKAGNGTDVDLELADGTKSCPNCDAEAVYVAAWKKSQVAPVAGGMTLFPEVHPKVGFRVKDRDGKPVYDAVAELDDALKTPGKTETTMIPLGEKFSLEVKATVVPTTPETAKKAETPTTQR